MNRKQLLGIGTGFARDIKASAERKRLLATASTTDGLEKLIAAGVKGVPNNRGGFDYFINPIIVNSQTNEGMSFEKLRNKDNY